MPNKVKHGANIRFLLVRYIILMFKIGLITSARRSHTTSMNQASPQDILYVMTVIKPGCRERISKIFQAKGKKNNVEHIIVWRFYLRPIHTRESNLGSCSQQSVCS